ncbi:LRR receptor-like serine/threonine-protein kinase GSO2 [Canna indica]|uniref:LRR receptor-like serine/threonine-protein kinase GSO2 n=1 Tax=Canna indica TaxID=4628 RepID=A0AAQ3QB62_9LILI|nr:LRR receptor-like serine/threonine-protein kinase GSO2 [Canna indica]
MPSLPPLGHGLLFLFLFALLLRTALSGGGNDELKALMELKSSLDPESRFLTSWRSEGDPCGGDFEGVACNERGEVTNISLQGRRLAGSISPAVVRLRSLTGLYLHYNSISREIPREIANLTRLADLYLNVNNLSGRIPAEIGDMDELQVLQLSYNKLTGSIPTKLGLLKKLTVLALQSNNLNGAIPASLGDLSELTWLDLSFNKLFGSVPVKLAQLSRLTLLDVRNNSLSGNVPSGNIFFSPRMGASLELCNGQLMLTDRAKDSLRRIASPLISLEYSHGWDPLADKRSGVGFSQEVSQSFRFNLEEVDSATQHFSEVNLLGKKNSFVATYKGILRDGCAVAVKRINKMSCKSEESEFLKGLNMLTMLRHRNLVGLRGFCYSRGRGECFLVYDFVSNGSLSQYLDVKDDENNKVLDWPTRVSIIRGIAKGIEYLHCNGANKPSLFHQNLSSEKVLIDSHFEPLLSGWGLHKLLTEDVVFSSLKESAAMGYLAPEYTTTGRFSEKSDVYAFGVIMLQILTGKKKVNHLWLEVESGRFEDLIDEKLKGNYSMPEAARLTRIALLCAADAPSRRPAIEEVVQEL